MCGWIDIQFITTCDVEILVWIQCGTRSLVKMVKDGVVVSILFQEHLLGIKPSYAFKHLHQTDTK